jgi:hypothetical protein
MLPVSPTEGLALEQPFAQNFEAASTKSMGLGP